VVLDEPNANLDAEGELALSNTIDALKERRVTLVMVGHRSSLMARLDKLASNGAEEVVNGLSASVHVVNAESTDVLNVQGGLGNDTFDLSDLTASGPSLALDGGDGTDTLLIKGSSSGDSVSLSALGGGVVELVRDGAAIDSVSLTSVENVVLRGQGGDDVLTATNGFPTGVALTIDGGGGNDTLVGSDQADTLLGGSGNDTVTGGRGNDVAQLGSGNDTFIWNPGDGSDTVDGQGGSDTLQFNGSNIGEKISISDNGGHAILTRDVAAITMDLNGVETLNVSSLGGSDQLTVNDLSHTDVRQVNLNLGAAAGGPDGAADLVTVAGTDQNDSVKLASNGDGIGITGLHAAVTVNNGELIDTINVQGGAGNDRIDASAVAAGGPTLVLDGGAGNDVLIGGAGANIFVNGETVVGFDVAQDQLDLRGVAAGQTADWVMAHAHDEHGNVVFDFGSAEITLVGESVAQLHPSDFILG
jgi:Ca2+-binding RTX toxin-like protein